MVGEQQALSSACPAAYGGGRTLSSQTPATSSDTEYGITDRGHHAGLYPVTGEGEVSLLPWLCSGGWRNLTPALRPQPLWSQYHEIRFRVAGMGFSTSWTSCSCFAGVRTFTFHWLLVLKLTWAQGTAQNTAFLNFTYSSAVLCSFPATDV